MNDDKPQHALIWAYGALALTAFCWGGNWIAGRGLYHDMSPLELAFWRWVIAAVLFLPFTLGAVWRERATVKKELPRLLVYAVIGVLIFNSLLYWGLHTTSAINGALYNSTQPVYVIIIAWVAFSMRTSLREIAGVIVSIAGVLIVISRGNWHILADFKFGFGDLIILLAMALWSIYTVLLKARPTALSHATFFASTIILGLPMISTAYIIDVSLTGFGTFTTPVIIGIIYLGIFGSIIAYLGWNYGVVQVGPTRASLFLHLVPVFAAIQAMLILGERIYLFHIIGMALILSGIYIASAARPFWRARLDRKT